MFSNFWNTKEHNELWNSFQGSMNLPSIDHTCWKIQPISSTCILGSDVMEDVGINYNTYLSTHTIAGRQLVKAILNNPINNINILEQRKKAIDWCGKNAKTITRSLMRLKETEQYVAWMLANPPALDDPSSPFHLCYPNSFFLKWLNYSGLALDSLHLFRGLIQPSIHTFSPLSSLLAPYWFIRFKVGLPLHFFTYMKTALKVAFEGFRPGLFALKGELIKYFMLSVYIILYIIHVVHQWNYASMIRTMRSQLMFYGKRIQRYYKELQKIQTIVPNWVFESFGGSSYKIPHHKGHPLITLYRIWFNSSELSKGINQVGILDIINACAHKLSQGHYCKANYIETPSKIAGMGHPTLDMKQQTNPVSLKQNLIVTGPNAAGKSTYTRSILANQLLAQTFGIVYGKSAFICPVDAIFSYMRVRDETGTASLYEAELKRCASILEIIEQYKDYRVLCFLDEPFHSTPPMEGTATSLAFVQLLGSYEKVRLVVTTHYHAMMSLEKENPQLFKNVSMEAIENGERHYIFPYKLRNGSSSQCIAIELLASHGFPRSLMERAIKYKESLYATISKEYVGPT